MNFILKEQGKRTQLWKRLEFAFLIFGITCLAYCAAVRCEAYASSKKQLAYYDVSPSPDPMHAGKARTGPTQVNASDIIGTIRIPQLGLSAPVTNDVNNIELIRGVGHIPGTAFAGGLGTVGLAGHRDTFFRDLRRIRPGMRILFSDPSGSYQYDVESIRVVEPSEVRVLEIQAKPKLVLVTCYPFLFVGAAPQRFIVTAGLRSVSGNLP